MRVLLADDQVWLRSALRLLLEQEPNTEVVGEVTGIRELPASVASLRPDLLFIDWELPDLKTNGARWHLITKLRAIHPQLTIIALTGDDTLNGQQLAVGADSYVSRAEPADRLLVALRQVAATRKHGAV
jgi:DNA-binding NarL/FixJ family response regulator